jgi:hypothetical protein
LEGHFQKKAIRGFSEIFPNSKYPLCTDMLKISKIIPSSRFVDEIPEFKVSKGKLLTMIIKNQIRLQYLHF